MLLKDGPRPVRLRTRDREPGDYSWHPELSPSGPVIVLVSIPDQVLYVYRNGVRIGHSTISTGKPGKSTPTGVIDSRGRIQAASVGNRAPKLKNWESRVAINLSFLQNVRAIIAPGSTLVLTDAPVSNQTQSGRGFDILGSAGRG